MSGVLSGGDGRGIYTERRRKRIISTFWFGLIDGETIREGGSRRRVEGGGGIEGLHQLG